MSNNRPAARWVLTALSVYALIGGLVSFIGWPADMPRLTDWEGNGISIQPNTTIAAICAATALLLIARGYRRAAALLGALVGLIGGSTIFQWLSGISFGIDTLLIFDRHWGQVGTSFPGRMGPLVEMHGGTVTARSEGPGRGSEFLVRLPVLVDLVHEPRRPPEGNGTRISDVARRFLVVDDNEDAATTLAVLLEKSGCDTAVAYDGIQALERASAYEPEVIVLDIGLPGMSGYDVCRALRHRPNGRNLIMIALTGWGQDEDRRKSAAAGFDGHLVKPVKLDELNALLTTLRSKTA